MDEAIGRWMAMTGARLGLRVVVPDQRVEIAMLELGDSRIELIRPTDGESGVARFLAKHGESLHHVGILVPDVARELERLAASGFDLVDKTPRPGADGMVAFVHPRSTGGVLLELVQRPGD